MGKWWGSGERRIAGGPPPPPPPQTFSSQDPRQAAPAELYQTTKANHSNHLKHIFEEGELKEDSVVKSYLTTAADGKNYWVKHYNLEAVLAVGYRVRSSRGTQFRQWATARLQEHLTKGFAMDDTSSFYPGQS